MFALRRIIGPWRAKESRETAFDAHGASSFVSAPEGRVEPPAGVFGEQRRRSAKSAGVKDEAQSVEQDLGGKDSGGAGGIVIGGDLDQIDADDVVFLGDLLQ